MQSEHLITVATMFALVWAVGATVALLRPSNMMLRCSILYVVASFAALASVLWMNSVLSLGRNWVVYLTDELQTRDLRHLCAAGLGLSLGFGPAVWPWQCAWGTSQAGLFATLRKGAGLLSILLSFVFLGLMSLDEKLKPYLANRGLASIIAYPLSNSFSSEFSLEEFHECDVRPVQIAIGPDGSLYATAYTGAANQNGVVVKLTEDAVTGQVTELKVARNLNRPNGLAFYDGDLYVSRSGAYTRAEWGKLIETNAGAVTLLRDIDGDGVMDYYHDVVSDLPGSRGPDCLHQNNGIAFGPHGDLYITVGAHSDRAPAIGKYEGTILRSRPDGTGLTVFARGFRNPFGIVVGPDGEVFCTDNDAADHQNGDELNHVVEGGHYGFPYADGKAPHPDGTISPISVNKRGTYQGIAYTNSPKLPEKYRNCLYIVDYGSGDIFRIALERTGDTYRVQSSLFASVPGALDITVDCQGTFYVSCYGSQKIYRLRYQGGRS